MNAIAPKKTDTHTVRLPWLIAVIALSLIILIYVGYSDGMNIYTGLQLDIVTSEAKLIEGELERRLQAGLPLNQIIGFEPMTVQVLETDSSIAAIQVVDSAHNVVFDTIREGYVEFLTESTAVGFEQNLGYRDEYTVYSNRDLYRVAYPLDDRFGQVGELRFFILKGLIGRAVASYFLPTLVLFDVLIVLAGIVLGILIRKKKMSRPIMNGIFVTLFLIMALVMLYTLVQIYSEGLQGKAQALTDYLANRINAALILDLSLDDLEGLEETFTEYRQLNPEISYIALLEGDITRIHTDANARGKVFSSNRNDFNYMLALEQVPDDLTTKIQLGVGIPRRVLLQQLVRNIKNFAVLFLATAFLAWQFLNILYLLNRKHSGLDISESDIQLNRIYPVFFLANFLEGLLLSFLPQYFQGAAIDAGRDPSSAAAIFACYFAAYTLVLIPAGYYAQRSGGIRRLLLFGVSLYSISMFMLFSTTDINLIYLIRVVSGLGQGIIFIAVQSFILLTAQRNRTTQGITIIVYGYNGGIISGSILGGLLVVSIGQSRIFLIGAIIGILVLVYIWRQVRPGFHREPSTQQLSTPRGNPFKNIVAVLKDGEFVKTVLFIGIATKAILTGVMFFAIPLILEQQQYLKEDIAQILMFYAGGVLLASRQVARLTDRLGNTRSILFIGALVGGIGIALIGMIGLFELSAVHKTILILCGMLLTGLAHGCIHAPVVTHIASVKIAQSLGRSTTTSIYRFMERIGHVIGPIMVNAVLLLFGGSIVSIGAIGLATAMLGIMFVFSSRPIAAHQG